MSSPNDNKNEAVIHATQVLHNEESSNYLRTGRSGTYTRLENVRDHDHGNQNLAAQKIVPPIKDPTNAKSAKKVENQIEHVHEHRTMLSHFTL